MNPDTINETRLVSTGLDPALVDSCQQRAELFDRCFRQYAQSMDQISDALDQYQTVLGDGPRWCRAA